MTKNNLSDYGLGNKQLSDLKQKLDQGLLPQWVFMNPEIYKLEEEKVFAKTWHFLAHESEVSNPGDYVTRWIVNDPILVTRTKSGEVKAFLNSCPHRGTQLCISDSGNQKTFTCPYHGWSFNSEGSLVGVTLGNKIYGEELDKGDWGLRPVAKVESYQGMIFGNLDPNAESLEENLGDMKWYLDIMLGKSDGGLEVVGPPQRWECPGNWKMTLENFIGDTYHSKTAHKSALDMGIAPPDPMFPGLGYQVDCGGGHGIMIVVDEDTQKVLPFRGLPESMWPMFEKNLTPQQYEMLEKTTVFIGSIFPTLSFLNISFLPLSKVDEGKAYNYTTFRVWRPLGPEKVEVWSWFMIDKAAPQEYKEEAYNAYIGSFGVSGTFETDDTEIWNRVIQASKGIMTQDKELNYNNVLNYLMGMGRIEQDKNFPGPGIAYPMTFNDTLFRSLHDAWFDRITEGSLIEEEAHK
ncbi:Rieske 2Fe-2S domain-containing protein [Bacillus sp. OK048]|uniref:aromatic ring-hydroxylating oxygenase subunit alpha n=1 Tax=Bacillus sp. OK048 TaxID=1882761 RepID=UPI00088AA154|nr:Rieske 2Fe-2S domain-containing protein [Bacillus sp. OK048]SDL97935.1 Phenylpropionate dioxygenase, large terminal subunit [Bacillus sp. OK048]